MLVAFIYLGKKDYNEEVNHTKDSILMARTFSSLDKNNIFQIMDNSELINFLNHGTGVILFCYKEALWCNEYAGILNRVSALFDLEKIYYYDILEEREANSYYYQQILNKGKQYLYQSELGKTVLNVPQTYFLKSGELIGQNNDVAKVVGVIKPAQYWTVDNIVDLEVKLQDLLQRLLYNS